MANEKIDQKRKFESDMHLIAYIIHSRKGLKNKVDTFFALQKERLNFKK